MACFNRNPLQSITKKLSNRTLETVLRIYDAVADHSLWGAVLDQIVDETGAKGCLVFEFDNPSLKTSLCSSFYDMDALADYNRKFQLSETNDQNVFVDKAQELDTIEVISDNVLYDDLEAFKQRKNVQYVMGFGILHRAAASLNKDNRDIARFSVQFSSDRGPITEAEISELNQFLPHLAKALELGRPAMQLALMHQGLIAAMDRLKIGVCVLDPQGRVITANEEFHRQCDVHSVFSIYSSGELGFSKPADQQRFVELKSHALAHGRHGARPRKEAISTNSNGVLCIEVAPLDKSDEIGSTHVGGCVVYSTDTLQPMRCNTALLQNRFSLTPTEIELLSAISEGLTNSQIAERRGRAVTTINNQVKSVLTKTHCSTRTQLARMMMSFGMDYLK